MILRMISMLAGIALASYAPLSAERLDSLLMGGAATAFSTALPLVLFSLLLVLDVALGRYFKAPDCRSFSSKIVVPAALALLWCAAGLAHGIIYASSMSQHLLLPENEGELIEITGAVVGLPTEELRYGKTVQRFDLQVASARWPVSERPLRRVRLSWYSGPRIKAGQLWTLRGKLKRPRGLANSAGFDYQLYLHLQDIDATGYISWGQPANYIPTFETRWQMMASRARGAVAARLAEAGAELSSHRLLRALAIGDGKALKNEDWDLLRSTGTTHLFVISGLHVGMLGGIAYGLMFFVLRFLAPIWPSLVPQRGAAIAACAAAFCYACLAGFSLPTQRAVIMLGLGMLGRSYGLQVPLASVFLFAALAVCLAEPLAVRSAGFWLSFSAVGALLLVFSGRVNSAGNWFMATLRAQWVSFIALSPLLLFWFSTTSMVMPAVNLLAVPLLSLVIVPLVFIALMMMAVSSPISEQVLLVLDSALQLLWSFLRSAASLSAGWTEFDSSLSLLQLVPLLIAAAILLAPRVLRARLLFLVPFLLSPLFAAGFSNWPQAATKVYSNQHSDRQADCGFATLEVLDVGQGLSVLFSAHNKALLYDAGARYGSGFDIGASVVAPRLLAENIRALDTMVLSHSDNDHYGGFAEIQRRFPIRSVFSSFSDTGLNAERCAAGRSNWMWQNIAFEFLNQPADVSRAGSANNNSCVLKITAPGFSILLPGDIESEAETALLNSAAALDADLLLAPHHGSKSSSGADFIRAVSPDYVIFSAAYKGRFGHPHAEVLARYDQIGARLINTADSGAIQFRLPICAAGSLPKPSSQRQRAGNYWLGW